MNQSEPIFSATLASGSQAPGVYWFTWYLLPNPPVHDVNPKEDWELQIHDAAGRELHRVKAPRELKTLWKRRPIGDPIHVRAGTPIKQELFEKPHVAGARSVTVVFLELEMERAALVDQSPAAASAELWAPRLAPGEKPKPYEILQEASSLAEQGLYEEALQRHLWYHRHSLEFQPSQAGVRLSFALSQWMELARRYPKAKDALVEIRDQCVDEFSGSGSSTLFGEIRFINKALKEDHATVALFKSTQEQDPKIARQCYPRVEELLVEKGEYALCASFVPDVQQRFNQIRAKRDRLQDAARDPKAGSALLREEAQRVFIKETRALVEILVGVGRKGEAEEIRDLALSIVDEPELQTAVSDAEARVKSMRAKLEAK